ncbi:MAG: hypothetical protein C0621_07705 [Desulfuromonas sp.]|nr:MAG: hypothetical protein C0621_07705 [Desulfuromonas sp.]
METEFWEYKDKVVYHPEKANKVELAQSSHSRATLWCLMPGQHIHAHVHAGDHIWVVLEGEGTFRGDGGPREVKAGTVLMAPHGKIHGVDNGGSQGLVFVSVSAG